AAQRDAAARSFDRDVDCFGALIGPQRGARSRLEREALEMAPRFRGFLECGTAHQRHDLVHTRGDWNSLRIESEVVEHRVAPGHIEMLAHARRARAVI